MHRAREHSSCFVSVVRNLHSRQKHPGWLCDSGTDEETLLSCICRRGMHEISEASSSLGYFSFGVLGFAIATVFVFCLFS